MTPDDFRLLFAAIQVSQPSLARAAGVSRGAIVRLLAGLNVARKPTMIALELAMCSPLHVMDARYTSVDGAHAWSNSDLALLDFSTARIDGEDNPYLHVYFPAGQTTHRLRPWRKGDIPTLIDGVWRWCRPRPMAQLVGVEELP